MPEELAKATHVYVKLDKTTPLSAKYCGPFPIVSRPSKSTVTIKEGTYVTGIPMLKTHHWQSCKIAHMRPDAPEGQRPQRGRPPKSTSSNVLTPTTPSTYVDTPSNRFDNHNVNKRAESNDATLEPQKITQPFTESDNSVPHESNDPSNGAADVPAPSKALSGAPRPFTHPFTSRPPDDDPPFHGFDDSDPEPEEIENSSSNDRTRPKRMTKQPDRLNYDTFAVRSLM